MSDIEKIFEESNIIVLPSYREGFPKVLMEAASHSKPAITTDVPGCNSTVIDHYNGFVIPPFDSYKLAQAMERFIVDPSLFSLMSDRSRQIALCDYNETVNAASLADLILS